LCFCFLFSLSLSMCSNASTLILCLCLDPVSWLGFQLSFFFSFHILSFSFLEFQFGFFQNFCIFIEFFHSLHYFHSSACFLFEFIQLFVVSSLNLLIILIIILLKSYSEISSTSLSVHYCGIVEFWRSHVALVFHISFVLILGFL
jgi:hypothetical protein